jgi:hypothetical protein
MRGAPDPGVDRRGARALRPGTRTAAQNPARLLSSNFGYLSESWQIDKHPRLLADTNGDGRADIVGFGNTGTYLATATTSG